MKKRTMAGQMNGPLIGTLRKTASGEPITMYSRNAAIESKVILEHNLRALSRFVPSCDGDNFALFLLRSKSHHRVLHDSTYKIFSVKNLAGLTTYAGSLMGKYTKKCLKHSVGSGAASCSFQLQESGFLNKPGIYHNFPEECWKIVAGLVGETTKIDAGGVKARNQAYQGMGLEACPPDSLFFGTVP